MSSDEDDEQAATWWVAAGWADLLVERTTGQRGPAERAARDRIGLALLLHAVEHGVRPGQIAGDVAVDAAAAHDLVDQLAARLPGWRRHLGLGPTIDPGLAHDVLTAVRADLHDSAPVEQLFPAGSLVGRGGGGPSW